jgi:adenylate kinase family enzyme
MKISLICVQGLPGSGRTTFANDLAKQFDTSIVITPEQYLFDRGNFNYNERRLEEARMTSLGELGAKLTAATVTHLMSHDWESKTIGVIIDDTSIYIQHIDPYYRLMLALKQRFPSAPDLEPQTQFEFRLLSPETSWKLDAGTCYKKGNKYSLPVIQKLLTTLMQNTDADRYSRFANL